MKNFQIFSLILILYVVAVFQFTFVDLRGKSNRGQNYSDNDETKDMNMNLNKSSIKVDMRTKKFISFRNDFYKGDGENNLKSKHNLRKKYKSIYYITSFLNCKKSLLPEKTTQCERLSVKDGGKFLQFNSNTVEEFFGSNQVKGANINTFSIILNISKYLTTSFVCSNFVDEIQNKIEDNAEVCSKISKICSHISSENTIKYKEEFIRLLNKYNTNKYKRKTVSPIYRALVINVDKTFLDLAYYYLDKSIGKSELFRLDNFDIIIFQTETGYRYLYRVAGVRNLTHRLILHTRRPKDSSYKINLNYSHENSLFRKNSLLNNFRHLKYKFSQCMVYKFIYTYYLRKLRSKKEFFYYYLPIIDFILNPDSHPGRVVLKYEDFDLWFKPKAFRRMKRRVNNLSNLKRNSVYESETPQSLSQYIDYIKNTFSNTPRFIQEAPEKIFYNNRKGYKNENSYLESSLNEQISNKRKANGSSFKHSFIDLYKNKSDENFGEDKDLIQLSDSRN